MQRRHFLAGLFLGLGGCQPFSGFVSVFTPKPPERKFQPAPPPGTSWTEIPYSDSDSFDDLLAGYITAGKPAIRILLETTEPDWSPRLNAWVRAFREGGKVRQPDGKGGIASLLWLAASAQTPTEARQLLENFLDRVEQHVLTAATWWEDEVRRRERVDLLRPYMMDASRDPQRDNKYSILLYNGRYQ